MLTSITSPGNFREMQICRSHSRPTELETLEMGPRNLCFMTVWFTLSLRTTGCTITSRDWLSWTGDIGEHWHLLWPPENAAKIEKNWSISAFLIIPRTRTPVRLNVFCCCCCYFSNLSVFMLVLCFPNKEIKKMISSKTTQPTWDRNDTRSQLFQPPMIPITVPPPR